MGGISTATGGGLMYGTDGYVTVNSVDLGATVGEIKCEWSIKNYFPNLFQARGPVQGTGRVTEGTMKIMVTITEWQYASLQQMFGSIGVSSAASSFVFGGGNISLISEVTNVVITGLKRNDATPVYFKLAQASVTLGGISFKEDAETTMEVTFEGLYTLANPSRFPGQVQFGGT